jgi:uncharacterized protein
MTDRPTVATGNTPFGYICRRCSHCCHHAHIRTDPYEVARLAGAKGESTTQFRAAWTIDGRGTTLRQKEDGSCVFLGPQGCEVHPDRPLVCRLYPLSRSVREDGFEHFTILKGHPQSAGEYNKSGTIADYLEGQGTKDFIFARNSYYQWFCAAYQKVGARDDALISEFINNGADLGLLDMDGMIAKHCAATGEAEPESLDDRLQLHLLLLYDVLANLEEESSRVDKPAA